jgi:hypothetical protein
MNDIKLHIPESLYINKTVRPKDDAQDITVEEIDGVIWIHSKNEAISIALEMEELRAIMRFFEAA